MSKQNVSQTIRSRISERLLPISIVDLDNLVGYLCELEKRVRLLERKVLPQPVKPVVTKKIKKNSKQTKIPSKKPVSKKKRR